MKKYLGFFLILSSVLLGISGLKGMEEGLRLPSERKGFSKEGPNFYLKIALHNQQRINKTRPDIDSNIQNLDENSLDNNFYELINKCDAGFDSITAMFKELGQEVNLHRAIILLDEMLCKSAEIKEILCLSDCFMKLKAFPELAIVRDDYCLSKTLALVRVAMQVSDSIDLFNRHLQEKLVEFLKSKNIDKELQDVLNNTNLRRDIRLLWKAYYLLTGKI